MYRKLCLKCGTVTFPKKEVPGSIAIELILWLFFIVPGLIYSIWRLSNKRLVCSACGHRDIVPADSPAAKQALAQPQG